MRKILFGLVMLGLHGCEITAQFEVNTKHTISNNDEEKLTFSAKRIYK